MMNQKRPNVLKGIIKMSAGVVVGAVAGFTAGILLAPKSGKETLEDVKDVSLKFRENANGYANDLRVKSEDIFTKGTQTLKLGKAIEAPEMNQEVKKNENDQALPVEQVITKVQEVNEAQSKVVDAKKATNENDTDSLLARIQNITADSLDDE